MPPKASLTTVPNTRRDVTWFSLCTRALVLKMDTASAWQGGAARAGELREMNQSLKIGVRSRILDDISCILLGGSAAASHLPLLDSSRHEAME